MSVRKKIAEGHGLDAFVHRARTQIEHSSFILFVGTRPGKRNGPKRHADRLRLQLQQLAPDRVHRDAIERLVDCGDERYNFNAGVLPEKVQRPSAILATGPGKRDTHDVSSVFLKQRQADAR